MELLHWLAEHRVVIITSISAYLLLGVFSLRWTIMGLIGYHNDPKGNWMLLVFIVLWWIPAGYLLWAVICGYLNSKFEPNNKVKVVEQSNQPTLFVCVGKGGNYEALGFGTPLGSMAIAPNDLMYFGLSLGAGTCRDEKLSVYAADQLGVFYYEGSVTNDEKRVFYIDVGTNKMYHRTTTDFSQRMKRIK
ncbi:hypothetical protein OBP_245 [Pseudomonas phage OBP]|uniref:hypothetical protein n=1 Tax=Pseudomonas phage OBP TaxID=1124849 RepID=UPI000240D5D9|nr:hypothetical protein OBP_245 [Pseudomonas phage OBP]AEV89682.1 hypothetical protein OBP_245 [Pseudomonas phage OBP]